MEKLPEKKRSLFDLNMLGIVIIMLLGYVLIHDLFGGTLFSYNSWDSYTLQALSWREGRLDLGRNYEYLELAIFEGKYYVSFPRFQAWSCCRLPLYSGQMCPATLYRPFTG